MNGEYALKGLYRHLNETKCLYIGTLHLDRHLDETGKKSRKIQERFEFGSDQRRIEWRKFLCLEANKIKMKT